MMEWGDYIGDEIKSINPFNYIGDEIKSINPFNLVDNETDDSIYSSCSSSSDSDNSETENEGKITCFLVTYELLG